MPQHAKHVVLTNTNKVALYDTGNGGGGGELICFDEQQQPTVAGSALSTSELYYEPCKIN
jgi:hypothetical protein